MEAINAEVRGIDLHTSRHSWLPELNASAGQSFGFGRTKNDEDILVNNKTSRASVGLTASMSLFSGFRISYDIIRNQYNVKAAQESLRKAQENISVQVAQAFLDVLLRKEILKINSETLSFTAENVRKTEIMVNSGSVPSSQLYEIKSQHASDEAKVTTADNDVILGLLTLAQLLELGSISGFDIETPYFNDEELALRNIPSVDAIFNIALGIKPQIKEAEFQLEVSKASLKVAKSGYYPQLSLNAGIEDYYHYAYDAPNKDFSSQMNEHLGESIGLSLSIPIFSRFATKNNVQQAQLGIAQQQLSLDNAKKSLYKEIQQAYHNALAAQKSYMAAQKSVAAAQESFRYAQSRYQTGKSSVYEFTEAKTTLTRSLSEEAQAKYNYVFAVKILDFYAGMPIVL
jgi:outer membrane protein